MKKITTLFFCIMLISIALSQQKYEEVVYLKDGSVIKGIIVEQIPDVSIKIQTKDGNMFVYQMEEIDRITKESTQPSLQTDDVITGGFAQKLEGKFGLSAYGGLALPIGDFADDDWKDNEHSVYRAMGYQFGLVADYFFSSSFGAGLVFKYASFPSKDYDVLSKPEQDDILTAIMLGLQGKYVFIPDGSVRPYGKIGFGLLMSSITDFPAVNWYQMKYYITDVEIDTKFYLQFGVGLHFFVSEQVSLFTEVVYEYMMMDGAELKFTDIPGAENGEIETNNSFIGLVAGINIWFGGSD